ncbi:hypothetical protein TCAL_05704 [Tigriopus californicus]|uniref:Conserved oligomeric Golgi complex subunit 2 n=1 Tax=Tigriopus californicus TaxID=6832 RepID=A0A553N8P4_TIGCA|nr:conserved oligomeric Golgi complex subunit 2-like [Tigriopus californicus]TRY61811.1 hypothetical protein TCAL_05704 [Tigriopus californicus]
MTNSSVEQPGENDLMVMVAVPAVPSGLSIRKDDFLGSDFSVDKFLTRWHSSASVAAQGTTISLETLRDDLGIYLKVLRSSMIELINEDYADFVNLSTKLVGLDESLLNLERPLLVYKDEVLASKQSLCQTWECLHETLARREHVYAQKTALQNLEHIIGTLNKVERLLGLSGDDSEPELSGDLVERVAAEINYLNFCVSKCQASSFVEEMQPRLKLIGDRLHGSLESQLLDAVAQQNTEVLKRCLRIFATVDRVREAEALVRLRVIQPYLESIITEEFVANDPLGLQGMFHRVLRVIPEKLSQLLLLTSGARKTKSSSGQNEKDFDFLVNSLWPEIVETIEENIPFIFSAGNPDKFFVHYTSSLEFVERFERELGSVHTLDKFRACQAYGNFFSKWNLAVYFQIRFQEIASPVETHVKHMFQPAEGHEFQLRITQIAFQAMEKCWDPKHYLDALAHRFWKLTLQILSRFATAFQAAPDLTFEVPVEEVLRPSASSVSLKDTHKKSHHRSASDQGSKIKTVPYRSQTKELIRLYQDVDYLASKVQDQLFTHTILPKFQEQLAPDQLDVLSQAMTTGCDQLRTKLQFLSDLITQNILDKALPYLKQVADIPRLYRRTNREIPSKPCTYLIALLDPISHFNSDDLAQGCSVDISRAWKCSIFSVVTEQFLKHVSEVLAAVQKMEESLKRLKRVRDSRPGGGMGTVDEGRLVISDDDKIRLQLYVDVMHLVGTIQGEFDLNPDKVEHLTELVTLVDEATKSMLEIRPAATA